MTSGNNELIAISQASFGDIVRLRDFYSGLPFHIREVFHPFPYRKEISMVYFTWIILSGHALSILKRVFPKLYYCMYVARDTEKKEILGFIFMFLTGKEPDGFVANVGIITKEEAQGKGIGSRMYKHLISRAKEIGVCKFRVTVMERNIASTEQVRKIGYVCRGYTEPDFWNNKKEKNISWELDLKKVGNV